MKRRLCCRSTGCLCLLAALPANLCGGCPGPPAAYGAVQGTVTDAATSAALAGATVDVRNWTEVLTDDQGRYAVAPRFATPWPNADLQLVAGSPVADAGTATGAPSTDKEGAARPQGNGYSIGAYER